MRKTLTKLERVFRWLLFSEIWCISCCRVQNRTKDPVRHYGKVIGIIIWINQYQNERGNRGNCDAMG